MFSGFEVSNTVYTGARLFSETPFTNLVRKAYELYSGAGNNRNSWDQTAAYYGIRGAAGLFSEAGGTGSNLVNSGNGANAWQSSPDKDQNYLVKVVSDSTIATAIENLMVQAPRLPNPSGEFVKGINLNGPAVTVDGNQWLSYSQALASGLSVGAGVNTATHGVVPSPAAPADTTTMMRSELWKSGDMNLSQTLANGSYQVYFWVLEDYRNNYHVFDVRLEGKLVTTVRTGNVGEWSRYGPYNVTVTDGVLNMDLIRLQGDTLIQGLAVIRQGQP